MAGNVPLFTPPGTQAALVAATARHVAPDGALVVGFQLGRGYELAEFDEHCRAAGLELDDRFATWDRDPFPGDGSYAVSVFRPARRLQVVAQARAAAFAAAVAAAMEPLPSRTRWGIRHGLVTMNFARPGTLADPSGLNRPSTASSG